LKENPGLPAFQCFSHGYTNNGSLFLFFNLSVLLTFDPVSSSSLIIIFNIFYLSILLLSTVVKYMKSHLHWLVQQQRHNRQPKEFLLALRHQDGSGKEQS
jgi:hypothetical protein